MATVGSLDSPFELADPDHVSAPIAQRFPVSALSWGVLHEVEDAWENQGLTGYLFGAVFPESSHLEPTIGQIWPRIG